MNDIQAVREIVKRFKVNKGSNVKLGSMYSWSIPPVSTCPCSTEICRRLCYAKWMYGYRKTVKKAWDNSLAFAQLPNFGEIMSEALSKLPTGLLRLHVSGDFFSPEYALGWLNALRANPHIHPFGFTRSWRDPQIKAALETYGWPKWLLGSTDPETGPLPAGIREANMTDVIKPMVKKGWEPAPKLACPEQLGRETCDVCGRCPLVKIKDGKFVPLPLAAEKVGVAFMLHK